MSLHPHERHAIRFLIGHLLVGLAAGLVFAALLFAVDLFGLRSVVAGDENGWLATGLLIFGISVTFGSLAMGMGVMALGREKS